MTFKVLQRDTCPKDWAIGYQMEWQGELLEIIEIDGDEYTWVDVMKIEKFNLSFQEFYERISYGHNNPDEQWRKEVGYRPDDKDSGFKRWLELTNNNESDYIDEFRKVVYGNQRVAQEQPMQKEMNF